MTPFMRNIAITCLSLCSVTTAQAEEHQGGSGVIRFGGFLGGGFADWMGKDADGMTQGETAVAKPAFFAGLLVTVDAGRLMSLDSKPFRLLLQPELVYAAKGTNFERNGEYRGVYVSVPYLQTGLLLRAEYSVNGRATPYLVLGPEMGFLLAAEFENGLGDTIDISDNLKSTDLGLVMGLGAMYSLPPWGALGLELRADLGLVSIDGQGDGDEIRNAALTLLLAYLY
jgi:Outer membrane protein beta-barrel domain